MIYLPLACLGRQFRTLYIGIDSPHAYAVGSPIQHPFPRSNPSYEDGETPDGCL